MPELRCPSCTHFGAERVHGPLWLLAGTLSLVGVGLPFFAYMTWRSPHVGDPMRCRLCHHKFIFSSADAEFPRGLVVAGPTSEAGALAPVGGVTALLPVFLLAAALVVIGGLIWLTHSGSSAVQPPTTAVAGVQATSASQAVVVAAAAPTPAFQPYWVRNHQVTEMWSGPMGQPSAVSFGTTSDVSCAFLVARPQDNERLYVLNPYSNDYLWIDGSAVGRVDAPEQRPGQREENVNCSAADVRTP